LSVVFTSPKKSFFTVLNSPAPGAN